MAQVYAVAAVCGTLMEGEAESGGRVDAGGVVLKWKTVVVR
jgi:hypothetical protein